MPKFTGVSHLDLTVSDVAASAAWYCEALGLREIARADFENRAMIVLRHDDSGLIVGLNQHQEPSAARFDERSPGLDHVGFAVAQRSDLDDWEQRFSELGVVHSPVEDSSSGSGTALVFRDPDNIQLELWWSRPR